MRGSMEKSGERPQNLINTKYHNLWTVPNLHSHWVKYSPRSTAPKQKIPKYSKTEKKNVLFSSVQFLSHVWLLVTPWTTARQAFLSITNSRSWPKPMYIKSVMPSNHLTLCRPLLLLPSIFPSIRVFSKESALPIRWPKSWSFSFNINEHPMNIQD